MTNLFLSQSPTHYVPDLGRIRWIFGEAFEKAFCLLLILIRKWLNGFPVSAAHIKTPTRSIDRQRDGQKFTKHKLLDELTARVPGTTTQKIQHQLWSWGCRVLNSEKWSLHWLMRFWKKTFLSLCSWSLFLGIQGCNQTTQFQKGEKRFLQLTGDLVFHCIWYI